MGITTIIKRCIRCGKLDLFFSRRVKYCDKCKEEKKANRKRLNKIVTVQPASPERQ